MEYGKRLRMPDFRQGLPNESFENAPSFSRKAFLTSDTTRQREISSMEGQ
jgi:hypothetical protein